MSRLTDIADRIIAEGAALVEAAANSDGRTSTGRTVDRWLGWVPGVDQGLDVLDGDPAERRERRMRTAAIGAAVRLSAILGETVSADLKARGLASLLSLLADGAALVPTAVSYDPARHDLTQLRAVLGGRAQSAAQLYVDEAAPLGSVAVPSRLYSSPHWATLTRAWPDFAEVGGRFVAVLTAYDAGGLPYASAGVQALRRAYPAEFGQLEQTGGVFGAIGSVSERAFESQGDRSKPAKRVDNPKVEPKTTKKSRGGGGALLLWGGLTTLAGMGIAAVSRSRSTKSPKKRSRR